MSRARFTQLVTELSSHPGLGPLASHAMFLAERAWQAGDFAYPRPGSLTLQREQHPDNVPSVLGGIDVMDLWRRGVTSSEEQDVLTALTLLGLSAVWSSHEGGPASLAARLVWLETYSGLRCLTACDAVLDGIRQRQLAEGLLDTIASDDNSQQGLSRPEKLIGLAWVRSCQATECAPLIPRAQSIQLTPPSSPSEGTAELNGDLGSRPRQPWLFALLAVTGALFVARAARALGRVILLHRVRTSIWLSDRGLELFLRHELLGRVLKERRLVLSIEEIRTVEREVRFPRAGLYAGLAALALGTLLGTRLFIDGLRVPGLSFPLVATGIGLVVSGILLDILLGGLGDSRRGRCRLLIMPHRGTGWAVGGLEPRAVDILLTELSVRLSVRRG